MGVFTSADVPMSITLMGATLTGMSFLTECDESATAILPRSVTKDDKGFQQELYKFEGMIPGTSFPRSIGCLATSVEKCNTPGQETTILQISCIAMKANNKTVLCSAAENGLAGHLVLAAGLLKATGITENIGRVSAIETKMASPPPVQQLKKRRRDLDFNTPVKTEKPETEKPASGGGGDDETAICLDDSDADEGSGVGGDKDNAINLDDSVISDVDIDKSIGELNLGE